jgi:hypothetical protein
VRVAAVARVRLDREDVFRLGVVERVVESRDAADAVPERRVDRDVFDLLPLDPDIPSVAQAVEVLLARHRPGHGIDSGLLVGRLTQRCLLIV